MDIDVILERAKKEQVSDILITAGMPPMFIIQGEIRQLGAECLSARETRELVYSLIDDYQKARFERELELDFSLTYKGTARFRGNAFWQRGSVGAALRLIPNKIPSFASLGLPLVVREFAETSRGLILITGPTGHGKSTTQAAMIDHINRTRSRHIVTVEDPIEFVHTNLKSVIEQREVGTDTTSFASALRHVLRQAPHVILVGEMRDLETIGTALTAAETGHLVLATLHTNGAPQTIDRIIDVFPPQQQNQIRTQISSSLLGVIAQRLLPAREENHRVLACEVMRNTTAIANLIREGKTAQMPSIIETQSRVGMVSLDASIKQLFLDGRISEDTARSAMRHPQVLFGK